MIRHVVVIWFRPETSDEDRGRALQYLRALRDIPGVEKLEIGVQFQLSPGRADIYEIVDFKSEDEIVKFKIHPLHQKLAEFLRGVADWKVVDALLV